jgi:hypothetical protein
MSARGDSGADGPSSHAYGLFWKSMPVKQGEVASGGNPGSWLKLELFSF